MDFQLWKYISGLPQAQKDWVQPESKFSSHGWNPSSSPELSLATKEHPRGKGFLLPGPQSTFAVPPLVWSWWPQPGCALPSPHMDFLKGFVSPEGACSPLPGRRKGLHASLTGHVYIGKNKTPQRTWRMHTGRPVPFFKTRWHTWRLPDSAALTWYADGEFFHSIQHLPGSDFN